MAFKPSYNIMDRDTHNALVNAFQTGGIAYTDDDGTVHKISDDYVNASGGSDLPSVTEADAGKVLAVNASGEWAAENKLVQLIIDPDTSYSNLTVREVIQAFIDGSIVYNSGGYIDADDPAECVGGTTIYSLVRYADNAFELLVGNNVVAIQENIDSYFYFD